jgi:hypothetical protein
MDKNKPARTAKAVKPQTIDFEIESMFMTLEKGIDKSDVREFATSYQIEIAA